MVFQIEWYENMMDKHEATQYILNQLKSGHDHIGIAADLSERLNAPPELALKFVQQVASNFSPEPESSLPKSEPDPQTVQPFVDDDDLPEIELKPIYTESPEPQDFSQPQFDPTPNYPQPETDGEQSNPAKEKDFDIEVVTNDVVEQLKNHRRYSDIVEYVAQKTGWHWNESQRFVARTQTENHDELSQSQNKFMIVFSATFILGGFLLMGWSVIALLDYAQALSSPQYATLSFDFFPLILIAFVSSFGIIGGGVFGLYRIMTNR